MVNKRVQNIEISGIRKFFNKVSDYPDAISLTLGQPDFPVPISIKSAMIRAIENNKTEYTANAGIYELRKEISNYLYRSFDIHYSPDEICITTGGSEGLFSVFNALINEGDEVLIPNPAYPAYESILKIMGAKISYYDMNDDFSINVLRLKDVLASNDNIKAIILSYPSNPTGAILSNENKKELYEILKAKNILIITDEIYSSLCYEEYNSISQFQDLKDRVVLISGFSKMFSMTGLRIGYVCSNVTLMKEILKIHQYNVSCATSISQWGVLEGLKSALSDVDMMKENFVKRRDYVYSRLIALGLEVVIPKGAFYIFPSIKKINRNSEEFCLELLHKNRVACVPGSAFGSKGEGFMRISYSYSIENLEAGLNRIENFLNNKI
ncbi:aminotransferase class I/II-fold pyridoxal phosphate-dependent enzyme [Desnuesiella massiliensis]|uniref:aminotransferase class I/II-fold pyridoxal phosphate-dependent enzyme n=1 Tax=Desnuesiella massiliensis TaxID=1650662 RepID=UPI0006E36509|nr:aminotransferase class I/II-fold pyridoxal phosphate-dependent enzyme [Desnuesiella massiliensis]